MRVVPLRLTERALPLLLDARVALDFTDSARWSSEISRLRAMLGARS